MRDKDTPNIQPILLSLGGKQSMSWEQADLIFPLGMVQLPNGQLISNEELKHSDIKTIYYTTSITTKKM